MPSRRALSPARPTSEPGEEVITPLLRVVFMGTPSFAVPSLLALAKAHDVVAVYTRPDAVSGRGGRRSPSPVKQAAAELGIEVFQPATLKDAAVVEELTRLQPDVIVVAAFGMILPQAILDIPALGCLNVHASVLPRWRGAAPIQRAILAGDRGCRRLDHAYGGGPRYRSVLSGSDPQDRRAHGRRGDRAARTSWVHACFWTRWKMLAQAPAPGSGRTMPRRPTRPRSRRATSYSSPSSQPRTPGVGFARRLHRRPPDCRWTVELSPFSLRPLRTQAAAAGRVAVTRRDLVAGFADGSLSLLRVRPAGRTDMPGADWARGARVEDGATWDRPS